MKRLIPSLLILLAMLSSSGCVVIEKKTMLMIVPPESNEIHQYYVYEGISVLEDGSCVRSRQLEVEELNKDDFFFWPGDGLFPQHPRLKQCRTEKLRFFIDPERKRPLCADRKRTISDRAELAQALNNGISEYLGGIYDGRDENEIQAELKKWSDELKADSKDANSWAGLLAITENLDLASIQQLKIAVQKGFRWIRFEPHTVRVVLPVTPECAKQIVANPKSKDRFKVMRTFVEPIDFEACDDGLAIVLGKKGQAIRFTCVDTGPYRACEERGLARCAGSPRAIILDDGKTANADRLIEQFVAEKTKER